MKKNEAINRIRLTIRKNGNECHYKCPHCFNALSVHICTMSAEDLNLVYNGAIKEYSLERTETCKALFRED